MMQYNEALQKAGVLPQDADGFLARCRDSYGLTIGGLMCIPPADEPPAPHFALTAKIAARNGLADRALQQAAAVCFDAAHDALPRMGANDATVAAVDEFRRRYVDRGRSPAHDRLDEELARWCADGPHALPRFDLRFRG